MKRSLMSSKRAWVISAVVLCISAMLVVGGTYALFTDNSTYSTRLEAGNLDITLSRTKYENYVVGENGRMVKVVPQEGEGSVDIEDTDNDLFEIGNGDIIAPTSYYQSTVEVTNNGSVAFDYGVEAMLLPNEGNADYSAEQVALFSQIEIYINGQKLASLYDLYSTGNKRMDLGTMDAEPDAQTPTKKTFTVKMQFLDSENNNDAMNAIANFDIVVYAVQHTESTSAS